MGRAPAGDAGLAEPLPARWRAPAGLCLATHRSGPGNLWGRRPPGGPRARVPPPRRPRADGHVLGWAPYAPGERGPPPRAAASCRRSLRPRRRQSPSLSPLQARASSRQRRGHVGLVRSAHPAADRQHGGSRRRARRRGPGRRGAARGCDAHGRLFAQTGLVSEIGRQGRVVLVPGCGRAGKETGPERDGLGAGCDTPPAAAWSPTAGPRVARCRHSGPL